MSKNIKFLGLLLTLIIIFIILLKGLNVSKDYSNEKLNSQIDFSLSAKKLFSDEIINISDLFDKNSPSVVNIWASWCAPCREEHQFLMKLKDMNINIIGINYKDSPKNAKNFLSSLGNPYSEVITDNDGTKSIEFGAIGVPETFIISGKTNEIIKKYIGPLTSENLIEIKNLLKKNIYDIDKFNYDGDFIESQAFAFLAIRSYKKLPISFPNTTNCKSPSLGGELVEN